MKRPLQKNMNCPRRLHRGFVHFFCFHSQVRQRGRRQQESNITAAATTTMLILTADDMLQKGLELGGFDRYRQKNVRRAQNLERFRALYGSNPVVYAEIFEDLQTTQIAEAWVDSDMLCVDSFLMALHFLKCYPTENQLSGLFQICEKSTRKWAWFYAKKIQALKTQKVSLLL